jgi:tetratricopeptide (TPR) repeat protein
MRITTIAYVLMANAQSRLGQHALATATLAREQQVAQALGDEPLNIDVDLTTAICAEIALNAGRYDEAITQVQQALALAQMIENVWTPGIAHRVWAQALAALDPARWAEAEQHFASSLQALEAAEMPVETAHTHLAWGKAAMQHANAEAAREHLQQAAVLYEQSGLAQRLDEVRQLLATLPSPSA